MPKLRLNPLQTFRHTRNKGDRVRIHRRGKTSTITYPFIEYLSPGDNRIWWKPHHLRHKRWCSVMNSRGNEMIVLVSQLEKP